MRSRSIRIRAALRNARRYQRAGVPEYWVVDLDAHLIERWRPANPRPEILDDRFALSLHPHGGALDIDVAKFFADLRGDR